MNIGDHVQRRVLVTGGSGFVGRALVAALLDRGHTVLATTTRLSDHLPRATNLHWLEWNASGAPLPAVEWKRVDTVVHAALPRTPFAFPEGANALFEVTVAATLRLLEVARREGQRVVVLSTADVLGSNDRAACEEDLLYEPTTFYGAAKACTELLTRSYGAILQTAILRLFHPYGPGGDRFLVNRMAHAVVDGQEVRIERQDGILLNPVWIDDLVDGVCAAVESDATGIFHLAGPETVSLRQLLDIAAEFAHRRPVIRVEARDGIQRHYATCERSVRLLHYHPQVGVREGVRRLLADKLPSVRAELA